MSEAEVIPELPAIRKGGAAPVHVHATEGEEEQVVIKPHWYRSTLTQCVLCLCHTLNGMSRSATTPGNR